jgi:subtilisin-like proprotein convertase family protein
MLPASEKTVGRVHVSTVREGDTARETAVAQRLEARFAPAAGRRFPDVRIISLRPRSDDPRFDVTIYDYTVERAFEIVIDADGKELERHPYPGQPHRTRVERDDAAAIVREDARFKEAIATGALEIYEAMPPVTVDDEGRRLINVGVVTPGVGGPMVERNEVVSVHIPTATILRHASGAPDTSRALTLACGPPNTGCSATEGSCSFYQIQWPAADPVWKLNIRHPDCTQSVQSQGTGLELTDVFYRDRLILKRAEVPVLNVKYEADTCGPFRDWLDAEDCFWAPGTDVPSTGSGIRVASQTPSTVCETNVDDGNFRGVAIFDQGTSLWLMTESNAGWYRYVMEWRLHLDGRIEPIFGFGATLNSCTCNEHYHHAYWRFEWAVDGSSTNAATGICTLERRRPGVAEIYDPIAIEGTFLRSPTGWEKDYFRVKNPQTGNGYLIQPGSLDGHATNDPYAKFDLAALALNSGQINDPNTDTSIEIQPWITGEALGTTKRLVTWYHATYDHDDPGGTGEACELAGPMLVPLVPCAGTLVLDRGSYACSSSVGLTASDVDRAGTGTMTVQVSSATEAVPESVVLSESPAGTGRFVGTVLLASAAPVHGDGKVSVVHGDALTASYIDASSCGAPNVEVEKTAPVDCFAPVISLLNVTTANGTATVTWDTSETATGIVHYGTALPTSSMRSETGTSSVHSVQLTGLSDCTTYYYWVESADAAGNVTATSAGGGIFAFRTGMTSLAVATSTDGPIPIPDNTSAGATSTITVPQSATVQDVNVTANVSHTFDGDLTLSLITPTNTTVTLATDRGASGNNFILTVFDDEAATPISSGSAPFTGSFRPETPLTAADGISAAGAWRLKVADTAAEDTGTLDAWQLRLALPGGTCPSGSAPPPVPALTASRIAGTGIHIGWSAGTCPATNYHLVYGSLSGLSTYAVGGGVCGLGPLGSYDWTTLPAGNLWYLVVSDNASTTEGSWGVATSGQRNGSVASGTCGFSQRSNAATCP